MGYSVYWGCAVSFHQPFVEAALRKIGEILGVEFAEIEGASCCPDPEISRSVDEKLWLTAAARNAALAERVEGTGDTVILCNGCFETFKLLTERMNDEETKRDVNDALREIGLEYEGRFRPINIVYFLHYRLDEIQAKKTVSLNGVKAVLEYGCRVEKEGEQWKRKFDEIVRALGVEILRYPFERVCCGVPLMYYDADHALEERTIPKLKQMVEVGADLAVMVCPACYDQLERGQLRLRRDGTPADIPMLNLVELVALALGAEPREIGLHLHRIRPKELISRLGGGA